MSEETNAPALFPVATPQPTGKGRRPGIVGEITTALDAHIRRLKELELWDTGAGITALLARRVSMQLDAGVSDYSLAATVKSLAELVQALPAPQQTSAEADELAKALQGLGDGR